MRVNLRLQRIIATVLVTVIFLTQTISFDPTKSADPVNRYSLVAILVDENLYTDDTFYSGLRSDASENIFQPIVLEELNSYDALLDEDTLKERVDRYALDVQASIPYTKAIIIKVNPIESTVNIANALEKLYFDGDGSEDAITKLSGVVIIGNVPIPVVNKNGNAFPSLFPYTDFESKAYLFNPETQNFERDANLPFANPEVWHGVIKPPIDGKEGKELLATYFDKNHLFHRGEVDFTDFDAKIFFGDFNGEFENVNKASYSDYDRYLKHWEDISYLRFTKDLFLKLYTEVEGDFSDLMEVPEEDKATLDSYRETVYDDLEAQIREMNPDFTLDRNPEITDDTFLQMPDIQSKNPSQKYLRRYHELFRRYLSLINDLVNETGRYESARTNAQGNIESDVDSLVSLISQKDEYTRRFLRELNDKVETKIDEVVTKIQKNIPLVESIDVSGQYTTFPYDDHDFRITLLNSGANMQSKDDPSSDEHFIHGVRLQDVNSVGECLLRRGSFNEVEAITTNVFDEATDYATQISKDPDAFFDLFQDAGGCSLVNNEFSQGCFPDRAVDPVFNIKGARRDNFNTHTANDFTDFRGCFDMKERGSFYSYIYANNDVSCDDTSTAFGVEKYLECTLKNYEKRDEYKIPNYNLPSFESITIIDSYSLQDVFDHLGFSFDPKDSSSFFITLANSGQKSFNDNNPPHTDSDIQDISVTVTPNIAKEISSVYQHKEPTNETINAQVEAQYSLDLPIDSPRYTTFMDKNFEYGRIDYPNIFTLNSLDDFVSQLKAKEEEFSRFPDGGQYRETLSSLLSSELDTQKIEDALKWYWMNIDEKHEYILRYYLSNFLNPYAEKKEKGYEMLYLVTSTPEIESSQEPSGASSSSSESGASSLAMQFNADIPGAAQDEESDSEFLNPEANLLVSSESSELGSQESSSSQSTSSSESVTSSNEGVLLPQWFSEISKWLKDLKKTGSVIQGASCGGSSLLPDSSGSTDASSAQEGDSKSSSSSSENTSSIYTGSMASSQIIENDSDLDGIPDENDLHPSDRDIDSNGIPDGSDLVSTLSVSLDTENIIADASHSAVVTVKALDSQGNIATSDNYSEVELEFLSGDDVFENLSQNPHTINFGQTNFTILSSVNAGSARYRVKTKNLIPNVASDPFTITSTAQYVQLTVIQTSTSDGEIVTEAKNRISLTELHDLEIPKTFTLRAEILNENNEIVTSDNQSLLVFRVASTSEQSCISDEVCESAQILTKEVQSQKGVAETDITLKNISGSLLFTAEVKNTELPVRETEFTLLPGDAAKLELSPESQVIPANGIYRVPLDLSVRDSFSNLATNDFYEVTLTVSGEGSFDPTLDTDPEQAGFQTRIVDGQTVVDLIAGNSPGKVTVSATLPVEEASDSIVDGITQSRNSSELTASVTLDVIPDIRLTLIPSDDTIAINSQTTISVIAQDQNNQPLNTFSSSVLFEVPDLLTGEIVGESQITLKNGQGSIVFQSSTLSGTTFLQASIPGLQIVSAAITVLPGEPYEIHLSSDKNVARADSEDFFTITAQIYDAYGNLVTSDSSTPITFRLTDATKEFGAFAQAVEDRGGTKNGGTLDESNTADDRDLSSTYTALTQNGETKAKVTGTNITGPLHIVSSSEGLISGTLKAKTVKIFDYKDLQEIEPNAMYVSLLGGKAGAIDEANYFGGWMTFSGKVQAVTSLLTEPNSFTPVLTLESNGKLTPGDSDLIETFVGSDASGISPRVLVRDGIENTQVAEIFNKLPKNKMKIFEETLSTEKIESLEDQIILLKNPSFDTINFASQDGAVSISDLDEIVKITETGQVFLYDDSISVSLNNDYPYFAFDITRLSERIATVIFKVHFSSDVQKLDPQFDFQKDFSALEDGVYIKPSATLNPNLQYQPSYSGNSLQNPKGIAIVDTENPLSEDKRPGFYFRSLEDAESVDGIGFEGENKFALLFAGGSSVGEANMPYASDIGINLGDPTIRLPKPNTPSSTGYTKDIGRFVFASENIIREITPLDYNDDGLKDLLLRDDSGRVRLLQNDTSNPRFRDRGDILNVVSGISAMVDGDFDKDGFEDLIIATEESCIQDEVCLYFFQNQSGSFEMKNLNFDFGVGVKVLDMEVGDMNNDGYLDLVIVDSLSNLRLYYNSRSGFDMVSQKIVNLGHATDNTANLSNEILLSFDGITSDNSLSFTKIAVTREPSYGDNLSEEDNENLEDLLSIDDTETFQISLESAPQKDEVDFASLDSFKSLSRSEKHVVDVNGGNTEIADVLEYRINIKNTGSSTLSDVLIADTVSGVVKVDPESFQCLNCVSDIRVTESGQSEHPYVAHLPDLSPSSTITLVYQASVESVSGIDVALVNSMDNYQADDYLDIMLRPENNEEGTLTYYYSAGIVEENGLKKVNYAPFVVVPEEPKIKDPSALFTPDDLTELDENGFPQKVKDYYSNLLTEDKDKDGLTDAWDENGGNNDDNSIPLATCEGGCIPMPINMAFLSPGTFNIAGVPGGYDLGLPLISIGPPICVIGIVPIPIDVAGAPCPNWTTSTFFRLYLSPTLTGGLGVAVCLGPYGTPTCFVTAAPIQQILGVCNAITSAVTSLITAANNFSSSLTSGTSLITGSSSPPGPPASANKVIPGFPGVLTDWMSRQWQEITDKLVALPKIYVYYPNLGIGPGIKRAFGSDEEEGKDQPGAFAEATGESVAGLSEIDWSFTNFVTFLNSLPFIRVEVKDVLFKIPFLSSDQLERTKEQWTDFAKELTDKENYYDSIGLNAEFGALINSVKKNLQNLEEWRVLPYKLAEYRSLEATYIYQLLCILDAVLDNLGGWITKNVRMYYAWLNAIDDIITALASWRPLLDFQILFMSCDRCTTDRMTLLELLFKFLVVIPSPPVIPFPKFPDIVLDLSDVQLGLTLPFPHVVFKTEPLILPSPPGLPTLHADLSLPAIPVIPPPPALPTLPSLPSIPLIKLPDLPPPPKIPELPGQISAVIDILKKIMSILCKLIESVIPVPEPYVKTQVEKLTERGLTPLLNFDLSLGFQYPTISFDIANSINILSHLNIIPNFDTVIESLKKYSKTFNNYTGNMGNIWDEVMRRLEQAAQAPEGLSQDVDLKPSDLSSFQPSDFSQYGLSERGFAIAASNPFLSSALARLYKTIDDLENIAENQTATLEKTPSFIRLVAEQEMKNPSDHIFAKTLDDIKNSPFTSNDLVSPSHKRILALRDQLIDYYENQQAINEKIVSSSGDEVIRLLAQSSNAKEAAPHLFASQNNSENVFTSTNLSELNSLSKTSSSVSKNLEKRVQETREDFEEFSDPDRLLAQLTNIPDTVANETSASSVAAYQKGIFIYNKEQEVNERLMNSIKDTDEENHTLFIDFDNDSDEDIVYSFGGRVYLKENFEKNPKSSYYEGNPEVLNLTSLIPSGASLNRFVNTDINSHFASVAFRKSERDDVIGYEIVAKKSLDSFDRDTLSETQRIHLIPNKEKSEESIPFTSLVTLSIQKGDIEIVSGSGSLSPGTGSSDLSSTGKLFSGDQIATKNNSKALLTFSDGSTLEMDENTFLIVPDITVSSPEIVVIQGEVSLNASSESNGLLRAGTVIKNGDAYAHVNLSSSSEIEIGRYTNFILPEQKPKVATLVDISGDVKIETVLRTPLSRSESIKVSEGMMLHPLTQSNIRITYPPNTEQEDEVNAISELKIRESDVISLSSLPLQSEIKVLSGKVEIFYPNDPLSLIEAYEGMLIREGDHVETGIKGEASISYHLDSVPEPLLENKPSTFTLSPLESFTFDAINDAENPQYDLHTDNGNFYAQIFALLQEGKRSSASETLLLAPQLCADKTAPFATAGSDKKKISIFKTLKLDASTSFDTYSEITSYSFDLDLTKDTNGDLDTTNDPDSFHDTDPLVDFDHDGNPSNDLDDPTLTLGPYETIGTRSVNLMIEDEARNSSSQKIDIEVFVPQVFLNESSLIDPTIEGYIEPQIEGIPIKILRQRDGVWSFIKTESSPNGVYHTDTAGKFSVADLDSEQHLVVKNHEDMVVAQISMKSGRIGLIDDRYSVSALQGKSGSPFAFVLQDTSGSILTSVYFVPDQNTDVTLHNPDFEFTQESVVNLNGVHVRDRNVTDSYNFTQLPGSDPLHPGAAIMAQVKTPRVSFGMWSTRSSLFKPFSPLAHAASTTSNLSQMVLISSDSNIFVLDDRVTLRLKESQNIDDPAIVEILYDGNTIAEVYIAAKNLAMSDSLVSQAANNTSSSNKDSDLDGISDLFEELYALDPQNASDSLRDFDSDGLNTLEEFKIGTHPYNDDTDNDGMDDGFEVQFGLDPLNAKDGSQDADNDGLSNREEFVLSRDPFSVDGSALQTISSFEPQENRATFSDVSQDDMLYDTLNDLVKKGVIEGYSDGSFRPSQKISRAEFTKIMLKILCINPSDAAYLLPQVFSDIPFNDISFNEKNSLWYFDETKESFLQGFITGYLGEKDPVTSLTPFKPDNFITRAEATKIILEALGKKDIIDLSQALRDHPLLDGQPWYTPYITIATDLSDYLENPQNVIRDAFILTSDEAKQASTFLSRMQFVEMASRVLNFWNCFIEDSDNDSLPDYFEDLYGFDMNDASDASLDPDLDRLSNLDEYRFGTDPKNPDTDNDGFLDGTEVRVGTDPMTDDLNPGDSDGDGLVDSDERQIYGTNPFDADTDKDRLFDSEEIFVVKTDPLKPDTDFGGVKDGDEVLDYLSNPLESQDDGTNVDSDSDGLKNVLEVSVYGTDPFDPDTDDGGVSDGGEVENNAKLMEGIYPYSQNPMDPLDPSDDSALDSSDDPYHDSLNDDDPDSDPDSDGLKNSEEKKYGTDPHNPDTDSGGVSDGAEVKGRSSDLKTTTGPSQATQDIDDQDNALLTSDPLEASDDDSDFDRLTDRDEREKYGTDPFDADSDDGGVKDGDEVLDDFTNPLESRDDDNDKDGLTNSDEINTYDTDPNNSDTDSGGVSDFDEVMITETDPLVGNDDTTINADLATSTQLNPGIYVVPASCFSCPCEASLENTADIIPSDTVFAAIMDSKNEVFLSRSNEITIK